MSDLRTRLDEIAGPVTAPSGETVAADLSRGRRALRRRRAGQVVTGSGLAVAVAVALTVPTGTGGGTPAPGGTSTAVADGGAALPVAAKLVAYTGDQPAGFSLDQVPEGWEVQGVDTYGLTLAPKDAADKHPHSFIGKIAIFLQGDLPDVVQKEVRVGDQPAVLATMEGESQPGTLFVKQPSDAYLTIQFWSGLNWSEQDIVSFAVGVHVHPGAEVSNG